MKYIALVILRFYQYAVSPHFPPACRYYPSCSYYAYEAITKYGVLYGCWLAAKRLIRCHPFHPGGYDPVPDLAENLVLRK